MRNLLLKKTVDSKSKISLITDESTTLGKKSTIIVFAHVFLKKFNLTEPINLFIDMTELDDVTAEEFLTENLVSLTCDGTLPPGDAAALPGAGPEPG
jgi:hypothetical protein